MSAWAGFWIGLGLVLLGAQIEHALLQVGEMLDRKLR